MPHILVAGQLHPTGLVLLKSAAGVTFDYVEEVSEASYAPLIGKADGLVIRTQPMSAATIEKAERLKVMSRHGVGYDAVDLAALKRTRYRADNCRRHEFRIGRRAGDDDAPGVGKARNPSRPRPSGSRRLEMAE
jgi:phosphoglycerate dehydrogenase-like enzyme